MSEIRQRPSRRSSKKKNRSRANSNISTKSNISTNSDDFLNTEENSNILNSTIQGRAKQMAEWTFGQVELKDKHTVTFLIITTAVILYFAYFINTDGMSSHDMIRNALIGCCITFITYGIITVLIII